MVSAEDKLTYRAAISGPESGEWQSAIEQEFNSLKENNVWTLETLPKGRKAIGCKWVFRKKDLPGGGIRYKARLVAKGYSQVQGVDYTDTFAPVLKYQSLRMLMAIANEEDSHIHQMDVTTAFLYGELKEEIYMQLPEGFSHPGQEGKVWRLHKSLYGLKQSPRCWNARIHHFLLEQGFTVMKTDSALYIKGADKVKQIISLYVDDLLIFSKDISAIRTIKASISAMFKVTDFGEVDTILGIKVTRNWEDGTLQMGQELYAQRILDRFKMGQCEGRSTPLVPGSKLSKTMVPVTETEKQAMANTPYREAVGSLMYLMLCTRPDIAAAVQYVSRFSSNPAPQHWEAVKHILRYVQRTKSLKLTFRKQGVIQLTGYSDSDWESCEDTRRSTSGYVFLLGGAAVSWCSRKQKSVSLSSCEAEYVAACEATREAVWETTMLEELGYGNLDSPIIYMDSQSAMQLIHNPVFHDKTKHIQGKMHYVREIAQEGSVTFAKVHTSLNLADILTKGVPSAKTATCRDGMGLSHQV